MRLAQPFVRSGSEQFATASDKGYADSLQIYYSYYPHLVPMQISNAMEQAAYSLPAGKYSSPLRYKDGYAIVMVHDRRPFFRSLQAYYINIPYKLGNTTRSRDEVERLINEAWTQAVAGTDFSKLVYKYSADTLDAGLLPAFGPGQMHYEIEKAAFNLKKPGDISKPVFTDKGAYILKLVKKTERPPFDEIRDALVTSIVESDRELEMQASYIRYLKQRYNYKLYPGAYEDFKKVADEYFPLTVAYWDKTKDLDKPLFRMNNIDFPQSDFAQYIRERPLSSQKYSQAFLKDIFNRCILELGKVYETNNLTADHPDLPYLLREYRDGILLFNISSDKVWNKPEAQQDSLEAAWDKELTAKYKVRINEKALRKLLKEKR
jgi:peptidyl-prolyl cis-trans isomerase SurA